MDLSTSEAFTPVADDDSDDELDWEEVHVPLQPTIDLPDPSSEPGPSTIQRETIEITLEARAKPKDQDLKKKALNAAVYAERVARVNSHKVHTLCLIANALTRDKWINDELLHARLMSLVPLSIQNSFLTINKSRIPDAAKRGRVFETSIMRMAEWWAREFFQVEITGHIRNKTFEDVKKSLAAGEYKFDRDGVLLYESDDDRREHEIIKSPKSLMKHALMRSGSRDVSAQLFTALCRALGIPARLVVSLQSVPWKAGIGKPKQGGKRKKLVVGEGKTTELDEEEAGQDGNDVDDDDEDMEEVLIPTSADIKGKGKATDGGFILDESSSDGGQRLSKKAKGKQKAAPLIRLRKSKPKAAAPKPSRAETPDPTTTPPVFWTEVFSRPDARWLPVDPIRAIVNRRKVFDPSSSSNNRAKQENRMLYVLAFEEDGFAKDVTPRYAKEYGAKVAKMQHGGGAGRGRKEWWEGVLNVIRRPYRLNRDEFEDEELQSNQLTEGMPTSIAGFKDHPLYVLARHLKREEVIHPLVELGKFRGEPVYPRGNVLSLKTAENWTRQGYKVREACQPMKWVKQRAVTVNKKRAIEMALAERGDGSEDNIMQGLYAQSQTELYVPDPIVDGIIPKNDFGNIDLYVPSMLPRGAAYIPHKGAAKIAKQLGFDYAEAVTSFEFKNRRAIPVISGIVVAAENESTVIEAYWQAEHHRAEKEETKRQAEVLKRWTRLVQGLRIRRRLVEQYKDHGRQEQRDPQGGDETNAERKLEEPGGFLTAVEGVIEHYSLPRNPHAIPTSGRSSPVADNDTQDVPISNRDLEVVDEALQAPPSARAEKDGDEMVVILSEPPRQNGGIKTMQELAENASRQHTDFGDVSGDDEFSDSSNVRPKTTRAKSKRKSANTSGHSTPLTRTIGAASTKSDNRVRRRKRTGSISGTDTESSAKRVSPVKRAKTSTAAGSPVPASDRVLRTRRTKGAAEIEAEKERERAYRMAVEE